MKEIRFTPRELDVMAVLWERGVSTVAEVRHSLEDDLAYTSVLTMLRILERKGYVSHTVEGRAYRYCAVISREAAGSVELRRLLDRLFEGCPERLVTELAEHAYLSSNGIRRVHDLVAARLAEEGT